MITLADVDGTIPGRAALVSLRLDIKDSKTMTDVVIEGEYGCTDPFESCDRLRLAIGDDFPDHVHTTVGNERARYLAWKRRMDELLGGDNSPAAYLAATTEKLFS